MPIVGVSCNLKVDGRFRHHTTGEGNAVAILDAARALPLLIPALGDRLDPDSVLDAVDGIMLTGGVSNIEPHHYGRSRPRERMCATLAGTSSASPWCGARFAGGFRCSGSAAGSRR